MCFCVSLSCTPLSHSYLPSLSCSHFHSPKTDTCKTCDSLQTRIAAATTGEKTSLEGELMLHQCRAERAYQQLKEDAAMCKAKDSVVMVTFDLQQSLPTPKISTNIVFYKRQMWTYNFGVHDCSNDKGFMYMWPESIALRGSKEVISCLNKHLQKPSSATELIVFSDACGGQNRNINVALYWIHVVCSPKYSYTTVNHKFMVSGHSYLPNDRDFGSIEKANRKQQHVYIPEEWCKLVESCRRKNPFNVTRMDTKDFVSTSNHRTHIVYRKVNTAKEKVEWLKIRWMQFNNDTPFQIRYRYVNTLNLSLLLPFSFPSPSPFSLTHSLPPFLIFNAIDVLQ